MGIIKFKSCIASSHNSFDGSRTFFGLDAVMAEAARSYSGPGKVTSVRLGSTYITCAGSGIGEKESMTYVLGVLEMGREVVLGITDYIPACR